MGVTAQDAILGAVALAGGLALTFFGISSLSVSKKALYSSSQVLAAFAMGFVVLYLVLEEFTNTNEWISVIVASSAGVMMAAVIGFMSFFGPYTVVVLAGALIAPYLLVLDAYDGLNVFPAGNALARQEFVVAFIIIFSLLCWSSSKTTELESHRLKYIPITAMLGGWLVTEAIFAFALSEESSPSDVMFTTISDGGKAAFGNLSTTNGVLLFAIWGGTALLGVIHQLCMRWGLCCYNRLDARNGFAGAEPDMPELPPGATLNAQHPRDKVRLVCENCFATVPVGTAFCTECGEAMPTDDHDANVSISQAHMPSVAINSKTNVPQRWEQVAHNNVLSSTSFVDPSMAKKIAAGDTKENRSIRFMDDGVRDADGKAVGYNDSIVRTNHYDPSFRSFAMSTYSIANRAVEPVETPNIRKYKMSGSGFFHLVYFLSGIIGIVWLVFLITFYPQEHPCQPQAPTLPCNELNAQVVDSFGCRPSTVNSDPVSGDGYCIRDTPFGVWLMYALFIFSEFLNYFLGLLFNFSMWRPIRRGARYMNDFKPPIPKEQWPTVDIFLCHYMEPVVDSIATLKNCLAMQYPPELLHVYILDDGYCKSVWDANNHFKVSVNLNVIRIAGDLRGEVARLMHERVVGPVESDATLKSWRRQHSSVRELRKEGASGIARRDCAVGSLSDDYDYRDRGIPRVTFVGRMKPEVHHSKAGNINNALFNEGADGKYILILDNDMKPHPKFLLAVLPFFFSEGEAVQGGGRQYSDDISWNQVAYVQTPQYFEETPQLVEMGDPCGHKNTIFFDAVQCGRDGFDSAAFAGTNAVFRRQAFDSIGGIQYGTQTEDAFTGNILHTTGWDSVYFRKDFEGDAKDRIRLCEGAIPETVAASMGQRKRWAKGAIQILLMRNESEVDPDWRPPRVPAPDPKPSLTFPRKMFFYDSVLYPFGSIPAMCYIVIAIYYLTTGDPPIYTQGLRLLYTFLPLMLIRWMLNLLANRAVDNNDVWRAQQTWFSYSFITMLAIFEAIQARITGREKSWANTGAGQKTSWVEIPNVLLFFTLFISQFVALIRFFQYESATAPWNYVASMFFGFWIMTNLYPMVKMSLTEYAGWDHTSATFTANMFGSLILIFIVVFVQLWQAYYEENLRVARGEL